MRIILPLASATALVLASPAFARDMSGMPGMEHPAPAQDQPPPDHGAMDNDQMVHGEGGMDMDMPETDHRDMAQGTTHEEAMSMMHVPESALGPYEAYRDGSGTSWVPDASPMSGVHAMSGGWMVMSHALLNLAYTDQGGPRGGEKAFVSGMVGAMAQRPLGGGTLGLRAMVSPDPFMGKSGYPLLMAAGETANGADPLIDRQHPHDLFMELSASYSHPIGLRKSVFVYAGLPGEPAFGPPAFMHRPSGLDIVEAPITHHWLDSTHITFGVVTAGLVWDKWKVDASRFRGREPDQNRFDIETGDLDSSSARISFNPTANWAFQTSWASIKSPEALEPDHGERRVSASAMYVRPFGDHGTFAATAAWARKDKVPGPALDGTLLEAELMPNDAWTFFTRAEQVQQDELSGEEHGPIYTVRKVSVGAIRDFRVAEKVKVGFGAQVSAFDAPDALGYDSPTAGTVFLRLKID
ncbi:MAG: hypothetical protein ACM3YN_13805 [Parcubacteria group bacterium]